MKCRVKNKLKYVDVIVGYPSGNRQSAKFRYRRSELEHAIDILQSNGKLPPKYKAHVLSWLYAGLWECHIKPDWLIIWSQNDNELTLLFMATGTHTYLFWSVVRIRGSSHWPHSAKYPEQCWQQVLLLSSNQITLSPVNNPITKKGIVNFINICCSLDIFTEW